MRRWRSAYRMIAVAVAMALAIAIPVVLPIIGRSLERAPVPSTMTQIPLSGVDTAGLIDSPDPAPHRLEPGHGGVQAASDTSVPLDPAVVTPRMDTQEFGLVSVSADEPLDPASVVVVRVREGDRWSEWYELPVNPEHGPDPSSQEAQQARFGTEPLLTGRADGVQVRIDTPDGTVPATTSVVLLDSPVVPEDASLGTAPAMSPAAASPAMPTIITRAEWGADESLRGHEPYYSDTIKVAFVHHTGGPGASNYSESEAARQVRLLYAYYTQNMHYSDLAYNFLVDRFGRLYEGRAGGMDKPVIGGHTAGFNNDTFAVSAIGNFDETNPKPAQMAAIKESIAQLLAWKLSLFHRDPLGTTTLVSDFGGGTSKYEPGEVATTTVIAGHGEIGITACPGRYLMTQLPSIRQRVAELTGPAFYEPSIGGSGVDWGSGGQLSVKATTKVPMTWRVEVRSGCDRLVRVLTGVQAEAGDLVIPWNLKTAAGKPVPPGTYSFTLSGEGADGTAVPWTGSGAIDATLGAPGDPCDPPDEFRVTGDGYGHGVGLSQWGAYAMAQAGEGTVDILGHYFPGSDVTAVDDTATIRVGLLYQVSAAKMRPELIAADSPGTAGMSVTVGSKTTDLDAADTLGFAVSSGKVAVTRTRDGVDTALGTAARVTVSRSNPQSLVNIIGPGEVFTVGRHRYRYGDFSVSVVPTAAGGRLAVVNSMRLGDEYLRGIAEVPATWPEAALEAQAIAARSYAIATMVNGVRADCDCHVDDGGGPYYDQTYFGSDREIQDSGQLWAAAVDATRPTASTGQALTWEGTVIQAPYTAATGGFTRAAGDVWGGDVAWSVSVDDHWSMEADGNPYRGWVTTVSQRAMAEAFDLPSVMKVEVVAVDDLGIPTIIRGTSPGGRISEITGTKMRSALGLRSPWVTGVWWDGMVGEPDSVTLNASPSGSIIAGRTLTLSGAITPADSGVTIKRQSPSATSPTGWRTVDSTTTGGDGAYSFTIPGIRPAGQTRQFRVVVERKDRVVARSRVVTIAVTEPLVSGMSVALSSRTVEEGSDVTITGRVRPAIAGLTAERQITSGSTWKTLETAQTADDGSFSFTIDQVKPAGASYVYRVVITDGRSDLLTSRELTLSVISPQPTAISLSLPASAPEGTNVTLTGQIDVAVAGITIQRQIKAWDGWRTLSTTTTAADGSYSFTIEEIASAGKSYDYRTVAVDGSQVLVTSAARTITVTDRAGVTAAAKPSGSVRRGSDVVISGRITPRKAGLTVSRQLKTTSGWQTIATTTSTNNGAYSFTISSISPKGRTYTYRTVVSKGSTVLSVSREIVVKVV